MAKLDKNVIQYLSDLSRIHCTDEEKDNLLEDLGKIIGYVEQLEEIDTENTTPCNHVLSDMINVMREDVVTEGDVLSRDDFLQNAPQQVGGLIRVPTVIKKG